MMLPNITTPICLDITLYIVLANQLVILRYLKRKVQEMVSNFKLLLFTIFIMTMQVLDFQYLYFNFSVYGPKHDVTKI